MQSLESQLQQIEQSPAFAAIAGLNQRAYENVADNSDDKSQFHLELKELSLKTPESIKLSRLAFDNNDDGGALTLEGSVAGGDIPPEFILAGYMSTLDKSVLFDDVQLVKYFRKKTGAGYELEFKITFVGAA